MQQLPSPLFVGRKAQLDNAEPLLLAGTGHEIPKPMWPVFVSALIRHTAQA